MATSNTFSFAPSNGEIVLYAFRLLGIPAGDVNQDALVNARLAMNFMFAEWSTRGVNLWTVLTQSTALVQGTATYSVPANAMAILDAYITLDGIDRIITPVSRTEYASYPDKTQQAPPTVFWYDRLLSPSVTLWPVPDANSTYTLNYYYTSQIQDADYPAGQTPQVQYSWLRAMATGLAAELAPSYAPDKEMVRRADAERAWQLAAKADTENVPLSFVPSLGGYYR